MGDSTIKSNSRSRNDLLSQNNHLTLSGGVPATEAPQRIAIYSKEPRRLGTVVSNSKLVNNASVTVVPSATLPPQSPSKPITSLNALCQKSQTPAKTKIKNIRPATSKYFQFVFKLIFKI